MKQSLNKLLLGLTIAVHAFFLVGNIASFFALPIMMLGEWYVWIPLWSFQVNLMFNRSWKCPLTELENRYRKKLGMKPIGGFVGHYIKKPIYIALGIKKKRVDNENHPERDGSEESGS
jgi:hypothetical protein